MSPVHWLAQMALPTIRIALAWTWMPSSKCLLPLSKLDGIWTWDPTLRNTFLLIVDLKDRWSSVKDIDSWWWSYWASWNRCTFSNSHPSLAQVQLVTHMGIHLAWWLLGPTILESAFEFLHFPPLRFYITQDWVKVNMGTIKYHAQLLFPCTKHSVFKISCSYFGSFFIFLCKYYSCPNNIKCTCGREIWTDP